MASQKKRRRGWRTYALLFCLTVFLVSGGFLVRDLVRSAGEQAANRDLAQQVRAAREAAGRLSCLLAERADTVVRVCCGLPQVLKGELPC